MAAVETLATPFSEPCCHNSSPNRLSEMFLQMVGNDKRNTELLTLHDHSITSAPVTQVPAVPAARLVHQSVIGQISVIGGHSRRAESAE